MNSAVDWLLGLKDLRPGDAGVSLGFAIELPAWAWAGVGVACVLLAAWCYRRSEGPIAGRVALAALRAGLLALLAVLVCGPRLQRPNETIEKDWVIMLVDRSGSMAIPDAQPESLAPGSEAAARARREDQLRAMLSRHRPATDQLSKDRTLVWLGFDASTFDLKPAANPTGPGAALGEPGGSRTDLGSAIEQALQRAAARPTSGIVVLSDGRSNDLPSKALLRRLAAERIPIFGVPLGSAEALADLSIRSATGPGVAFVDDVTPIEAVVERIGPLPAAGESARVQLIDTVTGDVLDEKTVEWKQPPRVEGETPTNALTEPVTLTATPGVAGKAAWAVRVLPGGAPGSGTSESNSADRSDLVAENNQTSVSVELVDRPLRIVYIDGYPRWEYRFLQAIITREKTLASTAMLLAQGRRSIQEGNTPMDALPSSPGEWEQIDVIVLGDVLPEVFSAEQLRQIRQRVASGGAGLLWIAGEGAVPAAWRGTVLADLLPINLESPEPLRVWDRDVVMRPTPVADRLGIMRLMHMPLNGSWWPPSVSDPRTGWSRLRWAQRLDRNLLKPAAEVLATAHTVLDDDPAGTPLVLSMRYGAGRVVYVGTDEVWRWRYGRGEDLPERFWLQMVRLLGRESVGRSGKPAIISATPSRAEVGRAVRVRAEILDQAIAEGAGSGLQVRVTRVSDLGEQPATPPSTTPESDRDSITDLTLRATGGKATSSNPPGPDSRDGADRPTYQGTWAPARRGVYRLEVIDPLLAGQRVSTDVEVWLADDELRRPETDHPLLARLARETGGEFLADGDLSKLLTALPKRDVRITLNPDEHTLWDTPLALILLLTLVTAEWIGRRAMRLA